MSAPLDPQSPDKGPVSNQNSQLPSGMPSTSGGPSKHFSVGNESGMIQSPGFQAFFQKLHLKNPDQQKKFVLTLIMSANTTIKIAMSHLLQHMRELRHENQS